MWRELGEGRPQLYSFHIGFGNLDGLRPQFIELGQRELVVSPILQVDVELKIINKPDCEKLLDPVTTCPLSIWASTKVIM